MTNRYESWHGEFSQETGALAEEENFGRMPGAQGDFMKNKEETVHFHGAWMKLPEEAKKEAMETLMQECKESQVSSSIAPETLFAKVLRSKIFTDLNLAENEQLKFFTAVGSKLDALGVDGFFELDLGAGDAVHVTLDGTNNPEKMENSWKYTESEVPFLWPQHSKEENQKDWLLDIQKVADAVSSLLQEKAKQKGEFIRPLDQYELEESHKMAKEHALLKAKAEKRRISRLKR